MKNRIGNLNIGTRYIRCNSDIYPSMKLTTKNGKLTGYAFACGYVESKEKDDDNRLTLS